MCKKERDAATRKEWEDLASCLHLQEIIPLHRSREIYKRLDEIVQANPKVNNGNDLIDWMFGNYAWATVLSLRRLTEPVTQKKLQRHDTVSLHRLLSSMADNFLLITRRHLVSGRRHRSLIEAADAEFDSLAGKGEACVPSEVLRARLQELENVRQHIEVLADKYLAHHDRGRPDVQQTYLELDQAVGKTIDLFHFANWLLWGSKRAPLPAENYSWERVLQVPWIPGRPQRS